jgi:L-lactate dehydrogenase complex protein LldF
VYPGPIGSVLTPLLEAASRESGAEASDLAQASSLCGACTEACPVGIPLDDMLVSLRRRAVERGEAPFGESLAMRAFGNVFASRERYERAGRLARGAQRLAFGDGSRRLRLAGPLRGWTRTRDLPEPPRQAFRDLWPALESEDTSS